MDDTRDEPHTTDDHGAGLSSLPAAVIVPGSRRAPGWIWLVPLACVILAAVLIVQARAERGRTIRIRFDDGNGIEVNDPVMYRGVQAGRVTSVTFAGDLNSVVVTADLRRDAGNLAVDGSMFWVVRPEVSLTRVSGLETLVGPRYVQVEPGPPSSVLRSDFVGMERPPTALSGALKKRGENTGQLHVLVRSPRLGAVAVGSPVFFRDVKVGVVTDCAIAADAKAVEISLRIEKDYAGLVRTNSEFWNAGGIGVDFGFTTGLSLRGGSLESVITGGIAFATPTKAGARVQPGQAFSLLPEPPKGWADWAPDLADQTARAPGTP
ncbi:MAG: MlaD family protein [Phycisphaerales bacterium]